LCIIANEGVESGAWTVFSWREHLLLVVLVLLLNRGSIRVSCCCCCGGKCVLLVVHAAFLYKNNVMNVAVMNGGNKNETSEYR
jgi:hypothetical protein